jgi:hypothetical protein
MRPFAAKAGSRSIPVSPASNPGVWEWMSSTGAATRPVLSMTRRRPGGSVKKRRPSGANASDHGLSRPVATSSVCSVLSLAMVGLGDGVGLGVGEGLGLGEGDGLGDGKTLGVGEGLGVGDAEGVGEAVGEGVGVGDEPLTLPQPVRAKIRMKTANT